MLVETYKLLWEHFATSIEQNANYHRIMYLFWALKTHPARHKFSVSVLNTTEPFQCQSSLRCGICVSSFVSCGHNLLAQLDWCGNVYRLCGVLFASSNTIVLLCWMRQPVAKPDPDNVLVLNIAVYVFAVIAMVLLNSVNKNHIVTQSTSRMRKISVSFMFICFLFIFLPVIWAVWKLSTRSCLTCEHCYGSELSASLLLVMLTITMRFADSIFAELWYQGRPQQVTSVHSLAASVAMAIAAAVLVLSGVFLQTYCLVQLENKDGNWCGLVPLSYILPQPVLMIISTVKLQNRVNSVWFLWDKFFSAYVYCVVLFWPTTLYQTAMLNRAQYVTATSASVCIVLGARLFIQAIPHSAYSQVSGDSNGFYMY